jgi:hypothetical protein
MFNILPLKNFTFFLSIISFLINKYHPWISVNICGYLNIRGLSTRQIWSGHGYYICPMERTRISYYPHPLISIDIPNYSCGRSNYGIPYQVQRQSPLN